MIVEKINAKVQKGPVPAIFVTMNGHTNKLFKNILSSVQTEYKWEINTANYNYSEDCILILYQLKG